MILARRLWIGVAISGAVLVVGFDVVVVASCCWTALRRSRKQKPKTKINGSGNGSAITDFRSALKRKSLVLGVVWRAIDWLRGESVDGQEDFFREDRKSLSGAEEEDEGKRGVGKASTGWLSMSLLLFAHFIFALSSLPLFLFPYRFCLSDEGSVLPG